MYDRVTNTCIALFCNILTCFAYGCTHWLQTILQMTKIIPDPTLWRLKNIQIWNSNSHLFRRLRARNTIQIFILSNWCVLYNKYNECTWKVDFIFNFLFDFWRRLLNINSESKKIISDIWTYFFISGDKGVKLNRLHPERYKIIVTLTYKTFLNLFCDRIRIYLVNSVLN